MGRKQLQEMDAAKNLSKILVDFSKNGDKAKFNRRLNMARVNNGKKELSVLDPGFFQDLSFTPAIPKIKAAKSISFRTGRPGFRIKKASTFSIIRSAFSGPSPRFRKELDRRKAEQLRQIRIAVKLERQRRIAKLREENRLAKFVKKERIEEALIDV